MSTYCLRLTLFFLSVYFLVFGYYKFFFRLTTYYYNFSMAWANVFTSICTHRRIASVWLGLIEGEKSDVQTHVEIWIWMRTLCQTHHGLWSHNDFSLLANEWIYICMPHIWCCFFFLLEHLAFAVPVPPKHCRELCGVLVLLLFQIIRLHPHWSSFVRCPVRSQSSHWGCSVFAALFISIDFMPTFMVCVYAQTNHRVSFIFFRSPFFTILCYLTSAVVFCCL